MMFIRRDFSPRSTSTAGKVLRFVLAAVVGLALGVVALLAALVLGTTLVVRRLLGRRGPAVLRFGARPPAPRRAPAKGEVIDVEAREVDNRP